MRTASSAAGTCLLVAATVIGLFSTEARAQGPSAQTSIIIRWADPAHAQPIGDSVLPGQAFTVDVKLPPGGTPPSETTVTFMTGSGTTRTLTIPETSKGSGAYLSQPITAGGGAQKTGSLERHLPGNLSSAMDGFSAKDGEPVTVMAAGAKAQSFTVYDNNLTQEIGRRQKAFDRLRKDMNDAVVMATTLKKRKNLKAETQQNLDKALRIAKRRLQLLDEMENRLNNPGTRTGIGDHRGFLSWKIGVMIGYGNFISGDPDAKSVTALADALRTGRNVAERLHMRAQDEIVVSFALGLYTATASATMWGPLYTMIYGKNIYGQEATAEEIENAIRDVVVAMVMYKVTPVAVEAVGEGLAQGLLGPGETGRLPAPGAGAGARAGAVESGEAGTVAGREIIAKAKFQGAIEQTLLQGLDVRAAEAKAAGVPEAEVNRIVEEAKTNYQANAGKESSLPPLIQADFNLANRMFALENPDATLVTDTNELTTLSQVRAKAALEAGGNAQTWTSEEVRWLKDLNENRTWQDAYEVTTPTTADEPGFQAILSDEDIVNIESTAGKNLKIVDEPIDPVIQQKLADFRFRQRSETVAKDIRTEQRRQLFRRPYSDQPAMANVLDPKKVKGTQPVKEVVKAAKGPNGVEAGTMAPMTGEQLVNEIVLRRVPQGELVRLGKEPPVSGERVATNARQMEVEVLNGKNIDALTQEEISRLKPEDIKKLPPDFQNGLSLNQLSTAQMEALDSLVLNDQKIGSLTPDTIKRLPPSLRNLVAWDVGILSPEQVRALAQAMGITDVAPAGSLGAPTNPAAVTAAGASAANGLQSAPFSGSGGLDALGKAMAEQSKEVPPPAWANQPIGGKPPGGSSNPYSVWDLLKDDVTGRGGPSGSGTGGNGSATGGNLGGGGAGNGGNIAPGPTTGTSNQPGGSIQTGNAGGASGNSQQPVIVPPTPAGSTGASSGGAIMPGGFNFNNFLLPPAQPLQLVEKLDPSKPQNPITESLLVTDEPGTVPSDVGSGFFVNQGNQYLNISSGLGSGPIDFLFQDITIESLKTSLSSKASGRPHASRQSAAPVVGTLVKAGSMRSTLAAWLRLPTLAASWTSGTMNVPEVRLIPGSVVRFESMESSAEAGPGPQVGISLVATGASSGQVFQMQVVNPGGAEGAIVAPDGLVVEPLKRGSAEPVAARAKGGVQAESVVGYCLDFAKAPPTPGTMYRVAEEALQKKFRPVRYILQAGRKLQAAGLLHPDSNPANYVDGIKQWATWAHLEHWDLKAFGENFVARTKKNIEALKHNWTGQMEAAIRGAIPGRWKDIMAVEEEARRLMAAAPAEGAR